MSQRNKRESNCNVLDKTHPLYNKNVVHIKEKAQSVEETKKH